VGLVQDRAPIFNSQAPGLQHESSIAALQRACIHEKKFQEEQEEAKKEETKKTLEEEAKQKTETKFVAEEAVETAAPFEPTAPEPPAATLPPLRVPSFTTLLVPSQVTSRFGSQVSLDSLSAPSHRVTVSVGNIPRISTVEAPAVAHAQQGTSYTPHDRGHYLAYSAPGSRHGSVDHTPSVSRPVSPTHGLSVRGHGNSSSLRPAASTSRLHQLLAEEGVRRALSPLAEDISSDRHSGVSDGDMVANLSVAQGWIDPDDIDAFVKTVSRRPSRPSSRPASRRMSRVQNRSPQPSTPDDEIDGGLFLPGLGHPDVVRCSSRNHSRSQSPMPPSVRSGFRMGSVDYDTGNRPSSRPYSPMPTGSPSYESAESAAYLRGLAQNNYKMENRSSRSCSPLPPATQELVFFDQLEQSSRSHTPVSHELISRHGFATFNQLSRAHSPIQPVMQQQGYRHGPTQFDQLSRTHSPMQPVMQEQVHLHGGLGNARQPSQPLVHWHTTAFPAFTSRTQTPTVHISMPLNTGRPRAASQALNEAYNAAHPSSTTPRPLIQPNKHDDFNFPDPNRNLDNETSITPRDPKCAIHDSTCDNKTVTNLHHTESARRGAGFVDLFPFIKGEGIEERVMVDWVALRDEEMEKLRRAGLYPLASASL
jgi:hypothetical protein